MYKVVGATSKKIYFSSHDKTAAERYARSGGFFEIIMIIGE